MQKSELSNVNIIDEQVLITPDELKAKLPLSDNARRFIQESRQTIANIIHKKDHRMLVVCGPCSIHDVEAAKEYAKRLKALSEELSDQLYIVMRVYFEKPRTTVGWKGLINDPHLDGTFDIEHGLHVGRELLVELAEMEIPLATEALDPISPQYLADTFSWAAIGARTTESQTHREMASGLSMPIGFKNGTDGNLGTAINAMQAASSSHRFMGISREGQVALLAEDVIHQIREGNKSIIGLMIESHLNEGNQSSDIPLDQMKYGVSITDACINWDSTEALLKRAHTELVPFLENRLKG
ncbi:3-deoxy-7-phosphoheptulonate synthase [Vibrio fortis]|uniref:3-deoxy-7-phosphoheptulonate synthase n=1 Tax=Vibrio fortis TaxID=212667 RepID=UPI002F42C05D